MAWKAIGHSRCVWLVLWVSGPYKRTDIFSSCQPFEYYADRELKVTQELLDRIHHNDIYYSVVSKFLDVKYNRSKRHHEVQVKRKEFDHGEPTWESNHVLHEDNPDMLKLFLEAHHDQEIKLNEQQKRFWALEREDYSYESIRLLASHK